MSNDTPNNREFQCHAKEARTWADARRAAAVLLSSALLVAACDKDSSSSQNDKITSPSTSEQYSPPSPFDESHLDDGPAPKYPTVPTDQQDRVHSGIVRPPSSIDESHLDDGPAPKYPAP